MSRDHAIALHNKSTSAWATERDSVSKKKKCFFVLFSSMSMYSRPKYKDAREGEVKNLLILHFMLRKDVIAKFHLKKNVMFLIPLFSLIFFFEDIRAQEES